MFQWSYSHRTCIILGLPVALFETQLFLYLRCPTKLRSSNCLSSEAENAIFLYLISKHAEGFLFAGLQQNHRWDCSNLSDDLTVLISTCLCSNLNLSRSYNNVYVFALTAVVINVIGNYDLL